MISFGPHDAPVLVITFAGETNLMGQREGLEQLIRICEQHDAAGTTFCVLTDFRRAATPKASVRLLTVNTILEHRDLLHRTLNGWAFVLTSPLTRGVITAISWIAPLPFPSKSFATEADARDWCEEQNR